LGMLPRVIRLLESGEYTAQKDFDIAVLNRKARELCREHDIRFDGSSIVPSDNSLARDVFEAGFRLALEVGVYLLDTGRRILIPEEDLTAAMRRHRGSIVIGDGKDSRVMEHRGVEDTRPPVVIAGFAGTPTPTSYYLESAISYALEPHVDAVDHGSIVEVYGAKVAARAPTEATAARMEVRMVREALRRAGRPGLHIVGGESAVSAVGALAAIGDEHLRRSDGLLVPVLNEMKVSNDTLTKAQVFNEYGGHVVSLVDPVLGGYAGGPEGTAICSVAEVVSSSLLYGASYFLIHPTHILLQATSVPECMWVQSIVGQALALETPFIAAGNVWPAAGGGTRQVVYELAANTIANVVSGLHLLGVTCTAGRLPHSSGLEARLMGEVAHVACRLRREDANELVTRLVKMYRDRLKNPELGLEFSSLYDLETVKPREEVLAVYRDACRTVEEVIGENTFSLL